MDSAIMFLFISVVIIGIVLVVIINLTRKSPHTLDKRHYQEQWLSIEQSVGTDNGSMQFAIVQADKLLDKALKERGFAGQTMGERMKSAQKNMTNPDAVWAAHKIRNRIAHEDSMTVGRKQTLQALQGLKRALRDLGAL